MVIRKEAEIMPSFYYGLAYKKYESYEEVYYIMPFNYIVRWKRYLHHWWIRNIQHRESWFDKEVRKIRREIHSYYGDQLQHSYKESDKYRHAYYEVMKALYKTDTSKEEKQRLFELG